MIINEDLDMDFVLNDSKPKGIIGIGAFEGFEGLWSDFYRSHGVKNICWIKGCPETFEKLKANVPPEDMCINVAVCETDKPVVFNVINNYKHIINTYQVQMQGRSMDSLIDSGEIDINKYDFVLMDLQGAEYYALKGFEKYIHKINYIVAEVNYIELYEGCMLSNDFDNYIMSLGFEKVMATHYTSSGWGDTYYKRIKK